MSLKNTPTSRSQTVRVGITIGDPSGIGPEITLKAISRFDPAVDFTVIGDAWVLGRFKALSSTLRLRSGLMVSPSTRFACSGRMVSLSNQSAAEPSKLKGARVIDLQNVRRRNFKFGQVKPEYGKACIEYLDYALDLIREGAIDCLVTCPISKEAINLAGCHFAGHTEYLAARTKTDRYVMMLLNAKMKIALHTRHIPLKSVAAAVRADKIYEDILITYRCLKDMFGIGEPRMVICGLNPHASDNGIIGNEENAVIRPAIRKARKQIKNITGPLSADIALLKTMRGEYDAAFAMYHDQALIALKISGTDTGVNITLGLPFVRTSPLHGTAFDIAGKMLADPEPLIQAIKVASSCARNTNR